MANLWILWLVLGLLLFFVLVVLPIIYVRYKHEYWKFRGVPHERPKSLVDMIKVLVGYSGDEGIHDYEVQHYNDLYRRFKSAGPFCGFYNHLRPRVLVLDRELVRRILIKDFSNFNDRGVYHNSKYDPLSADLYTIQDDSWREMRQKLDPTFGEGQMRTLYECIYEESEKLLHAFDVAIEKEQRQLPPNANNGCIEVRSIMRRYVLATIASCVFGLDATMQQQKYPFDEFDDMAQLALTTRRHGAFLTSILTRYPALGRHLRFRVNTREVRDYFLALISDVVDARERFGNKREYSDYLQLLIDIKTQELNTHESENKSAKELKDHLTNELAAHAFGVLKTGLMPTAHTLAYVLYEMALNDSIQQRLRQEVQDALQQHNNELNFECVQQLKFMQQVVLETLRLHPVTPYLIRRALKNYPLTNDSKYVINKDMFVIIPVHAMHNDPVYYPEPYLFKPERFTPEAMQMRDPCIWLGFGEGPRSCIGMQFAMLQIRIALARLLLRYTFAVDMNRLMIKFKNGVTLHVVPIEPSEPTGNTEEHGRESMLL